MLNPTPYYTYDDVLIKPQFSTVKSRRYVNLYSKLTKNIELELPIISSNMDTITEDKMAIEMAKMGGLGIIHRYCSIEQQVKMVKKVKRYTNYIINEPYTVLVDDNMIKVKEIMEKHKIKSVLVTNGENQLKGIITNRDIIYIKNAMLNSTEWSEWNVSVKKVMTPIDKLIYIEEKEINKLNKLDERPDNLDDNKWDEFEQKDPITKIVTFLSKHKIQKLPIVNNKTENKVVGLITLKDMINRTSHEFKDYATLDKNSQLCVGCAIGVNKDYLERAKAVIDAGCNVICIDVAHGHHILCGEAVKKIRELYPDIDIIAGNVCTADGTEYLINCGADCIKVGIGPGSICITRKQTGCGAPQLSSVFECAKVAKKHGKTIIADGGHNGKIGNIFKALCAGSSASMLGGMLSGTLETPGQIYTKMDKKVKQIRGMAGILSNYQKSAKLGDDTKFLENITPEGVEGYVTYKGPVKDIIEQIKGGLRSGLSYVGCDCLSELESKEIEFILITNNGYKESGSHNIKEI